MKVFDVLKETTPERGQLVKVIKGTPVKLLKDFGVGAELDDAARGEFQKMVSTLSPEQQQMLAQTAGDANIEDWWNDFKNTAKLEFQIWRTSTRPYENGDYTGIAKMSHPSFGRLELEADFTTRDGKFNSVSAIRTTSVNPGNSRFNRNTYDLSRFNAATQDLDPNDPNFGRDLGAAAGDVIAQSEMTEKTRRGRQDGPASARPQDSMLDAPRDVRMAAARGASVSRDNRGNYSASSTDDSGTVTTTTRDRVARSNDAGTTVTDRSGRIRSVQTPTVAGTQATQTFRPDGTRGYQQLTQRNGTNTRTVKGSPETGYTKTNRFSAGGVDVSNTDHYSGQTTTDTSHTIGNKTTRRSRTVRN